MITCLVCCARHDPATPGGVVCMYCAADLPSARATVLHRRQMSEARLGGALAKLTDLVSKADATLAKRWDAYLMAQAETPHTPQTQARLDAMARAYKSGALDAPMIELLYAETVVNAALAAVQADDVAIVAAERALEALSTVYELDGTFTRHSRGGGYYLRRVVDGKVTSPYITLGAALQAAKRGDVKEAA